MPMRSSSLANNPLAITRELDGRYDVVLQVRDNLDLIEQVAGVDFAAILAELESAQDFTGITVVQGETVAWDAVNKILTVPKGDNGDKGDTGLTGPQGSQGIQGPQGIKGDTGLKGDTGSQGPKGFDGEDGAQGLKGDTGDDLTITQITYNGNGTFNWLFSDGTTYVTPDLRGSTGAAGPQGVKGDTGTGVHHLKGTSTTQLEGDFGIAGETDTYTFYADAGETIPLGWFIVTNGISAAGDMRKSVYDTNNSGVVDNAEKVNGLTVQTAVPVGAVFTDTVYTHPDTHPASMITESSSKRFVSDAEKTSWNDKQDLLVAGTNIKTINGVDPLGSGNLEITVGSGGYAANVYLTSLVSSTNSSYNQISYTPEPTQTIVSATANNNEVLMADYIFDGDVSATAIPAGEWAFHYHSRVSSTSATSFIRFEIFKRSSAGVETVMFSQLSPSIENNAFTQESILITQPIFTVDETDRIGIKLYASTTRTNNTIIDIVIGDGIAAYFTTPLEIRHNQLRARDVSDAHPISSISGLTNALNGKVNNADIISVLNGGTGVTTSTGIGSVVLSTSPTLVTPNIGTAIGTSFNSITGLSSSTPVVAGTAAIGTGTTAARADHVHPAQTTITGNSGTATALATARNVTIGNTTKSFNGSANIAWTLTEIGAQPVDADLTAIGALAGASGLLKKTATDTWTLDTNTYVTSSGVTSVSTSGAIIGGTITSTGTISHSTDDGYLHVPATGTTNNGKVLTAGATDGSFSWVAPTSGVTDHTLLTNIGTNTHAQIDTALTRLVNTSGANTGDQTIALTGDITGTGTGTFITTLKNTGTSGTYKSVTTDAQGRVISGTNPTTVTGYGLTDVYTKTEVNSLIPATLPASDVYAWAKAAAKPMYTASEVGLGNVTNESKSTMFTSPTFTGTPVAGTAAVGTSSTQLATTAFVVNEINKIEEW